MCSSFLTNVSLLNTRWQALPLRCWNAYSSKHCYSENILLLPKQWTLEQYIFCNIILYYTFTKKHFVRGCLPIVIVSYEEEGFSIFTDMNSSVNVPYSGWESIVMYGAKVAFHLKLSNHPVLRT